MSEKDTYIERIQRAVEGLNQDRTQQHQLKFINWSRLKEDDLHCLLRLLRRLIKV